MKNNFVIVLDNIRSLYNVGSIFRTADAVGVSKIYLCGITGTPEHPRFAHNQTRDPDAFLPESVDKTALAGLGSTPWERTTNAHHIVKSLKDEGYSIVALEKTEESTLLTHLTDEKIALVLGNEKDGVDPEVLKLADHIMHIPMHGQGVSLNVAVAFGIAVYALQD